MDTAHRRVAADHSMVPVGGCPHFAAVLRDCSTDGVMQRNFRKRMLHKMPLVRGVRPLRGLRPAVPEDLGRCTVESLETLGLGTIKERVATVARQVFGA